MGKFFKENKVFLAIIVGAVIVGAAIYFSPKEVGRESRVAQESRQEVLPTPAPTSCENIPTLQDGAVKLATKIIDGDTFLIEGGYSVRILGIDADERDHPCYDAAKNGLEELILNKEVKLEKGAADKDQWCRYLRYVFLDDANISLESIKKGLAISRLSPEDSKYREEIINAEKEARENKVGCKWGSSVNAQEEKEAKINFDWEKITAELTGLKIIGACQAGNYYEKEVIIEGKIADAYRSKTNTIFLNFEKSYPNHCFVAVIFNSDQYKFVESPENYYKNKTVRIRGKIKEYQGKPEIILKNPSQIEIGK